MSEAARTAPVRVIKAGEKIPEVTPLSKSSLGILTAEPDKPLEATAPKPKIEPSVQLVEKENGIFEIRLTCSCGEIHIVECESAKKT